MKTWLWSILIGCYLSVAAAVAAEQNNPAPLRVGLLPFLSTAKLLEDFTPIKSYLENRLQRPVMLQTAPNFQSYIERAGQYQYDLYLTAPHIAALVEHDYHYRRVSRLTRGLDGSIVVLKDGPIKSIDDLQNRVFTTPADTAITTMLGEKLLMDHHLYNGKNITIQYTPSHNNAVIAVATGKADAAVTSAAVFEKMTPAIKDKLTILTNTETVPHMMFMASPKLSEKDYQELRQAMLEFTAAGPGKDFFEKSGYGDMGKITDKEMQQLRPYVKMLQQRLKISP
jgi:phosphonate transport system substrate-binding protein